MKNEKIKFSYYFYSDGEMIEEVDADTDVNAFIELRKRGYLVQECFDYYTKYNRTTKEMNLHKVR